MFFVIFRHRSLSSIVLGIKLIHIDLFVLIRNQRLSPKKLRMVIRAIPMITTWKSRLTSEAKEPPAWNKFPAVKNPETEQKIG